ncbi:MAG: hypothetical protein M4579_003945 [Chaenotheca gracillima]|nr:MAG: hypothetical protein M4579_003945 [Chaenotheca gracillima]
MPSFKSLTGQTVEREAFESLLRSRFFYTKAFSIYESCGNVLGDVRGLYDYGPPGCALQANIVDIWRKHFVLEEDMLELDCTQLTPEEVFKTSGHVERFADWMCKDPITGEYLRADHLLEQVLNGRLKGEKQSFPDREVHPLDEATVSDYEETLARVDNYDGAELSALMEKLDVRNPSSNNKILPPMPFNLMFKTTIGPSSSSPGYLRPETAQGQFVNFCKLLEYNHGMMPFASASIGKSFRNEISPRSGLLRVREFLMAEVEHFVDPEDKHHPKFDQVSDIELTLLDRGTQIAGKTALRDLSVGQAVERGVIDNQTLGYFLARIKLFLLGIGVQSDKLRFRQHMENEMAHYAADCWDAELLTSHGWIECVGCADRSAYDLDVHARRTGAPLVVKETRATPLVVEEWQIDLNRKRLGPQFRQNAKAVEAALDALDQSTREILAAKLEREKKISLAVPGMDGEAELSNDLLQIVRRTRTENVRVYTPNVIEPSFGIGRILYSLLEHAFWHRAQDEARRVLSLPLSVAPTKVLLVPLSNSAPLIRLTHQLLSRLRSLGIASRIDSSGASIGKRYARNDELGTPLGVTVDFVSLEDGSVTLRDRDSTRQVRGSQADVFAAISNLKEGRETLEEVFARLPEFRSETSEV